MDQIQTTVVCNKTHKHVTPARLPLLVLLGRLVLNLLNAGASDPQAGDKGDHGQVGQDLDLSIPKPRSSYIFDQIQIARKESNDTTQIVHPTGPSITDFLLLCGGDIHDQGSTTGLNSIDGKIQKIESNHGESNGPSFDL